jgi:predicted nucleic acid-binding protein
MVEIGKTRHHTFSQPDLFIAATASVHNLCVVTRNTDDFVAANVPVLNPWTDDEPRKGP